MVYVQFTEKELNTVVEALLALKDTHRDKVLIEWIPECHDLINRMNKEKFERKDEKIAQIMDKIKIMRMQIGCDLEHEKGAEWA